MTTEQNDLRRGVMKASWLYGMVVIGAGLLTGVSASAHHSFSAEYDRSKPVTITGPVSKVEWVNPHAHIFIDVKDTSAKTVTWDFELAPPSMLMRRGWTRDSLKIGDVATVSGFMAKDTPAAGNANTVTLSDGRKVFAGSTEDGSPTR
jgi:hypothetical protein